jgi:hypothetical protein
MAPALQDIGMNPIPAFVGPLPQLLKKVIPVDDRPDWNRGAASAASRFRCADGTSRFAKRMTNVNLRITIWGTGLT